MPGQAKALKPGRREKKRLSELSLNKTGNYM
jgi:hypothetical protein